jgi:hypothetical protein
VFGPKKPGKQGDDTQQGHGHEQLPFHRGALKSICEAGMREKETVGRKARCARRISRSGRRKLHIEAELSAELRRMIRYLSLQRLYLNVLKHRSQDGTTFLLLNCGHAQNVMALREYS